MFLSWKRRTAHARAAGPLSVFEHGLFFFKDTSSSGCTRLTWTPLTLPGLGHMITAKEAVLSTMKARRYFVGIVGSLLLGSVASCGGSGDKASSTESSPVKFPPLPDSAYRAELTVDSPPSSGPAGSMTTVGVTVKNMGDAAWPANGKEAVGGMVHFGYHWLDRDGKPVIFDGGRTALPTPLEPGSTVSLRAKVGYPKAPGDYILEFDMVHELVTWFAWKKSKTVRFNVKVT